MNNYNRDKLNNLGIFEIRSVARSVGVKSPTTLKKEDCIEEILKITSGQAKPYVKQNNKGRPPLEIGSIKSFVDVFVPVQKAPSFEKKDVFSDVVRIASGNEFASGQSKEILGLLEITQEGYGFIYNKDFNNSSIFISEPMIIKLKAKTGDEINALCRDISSDGKMAVHEVVKINKSDINEIAEKRDREAAVEKPSGEISGLPNIKKGFKAAVVNGKNIQEEIIKLFNKCKENKFLINSNSLDEDFITNEFCININAFEDKLAIERQIKLIFANFLNRAEAGENNVLFISDLTFLPKVLTKGQIIDSGVDAAALKETKRLFAFGKKFSTGGSFTIVAGLPKKSFNAELINTELCEVANLII